MRRVLPLLAIVCLAFAPAPLPRPAPKPPAVKFVGVTRDGLLSFEVDNPNGRAVLHYGQRPEHLKGGVIAPHCEVQVRRGDRWAPGPSRCALGVDAVRLAPGKSSFDLDVPDGPWDQIKVGVSWVAPGERYPRVSWSAPVPRAFATPPKR